MPISKKDFEKIVQLASEGKQIKKIQSDYFPNISYGEIQAEIGGQNALGVMRMITARINKMASATSLSQTQQVSGRVEEFDEADL